MAYSGQVATVSSKETWVSDFYQLVDEDTNEIINILNSDIGFDCSLFIKDQDGCQIATFALSSGKIVVSPGDDGPGFEWVIDMATDVSLACAGTYIFGVKTTANGQKQDLIIGTIAIVEGN